MRRELIVVVLLLLLATTHASLAATYLVRPDGTGDFPTIRQAIQAAHDGDVIELADGVFRGPGNTALSYFNKAITIRSVSGDPATCVIDCEGSETRPNSGVYFSGEGPGSVLQGVTISRAYAPGDQYPEETGAGVYCEYASPTFIDCCFLDNVAVWWGGGVACHYGSPTFLRCAFIGNRGAGGGMLVGDACSPILRDCLFRNNQGQIGAAIFSGGSGAFPELHGCTFIGNRGGNGTAIQTYSDILLTNCTFYANVADGSGSGAVIQAHTTRARVTLYNTIVAFSAPGKAISCSGGGQATLFCCDLYGNPDGDWIGCVADQFGIAGNIAEDPGFCDPDGGDLTLRADSPCAPFTPPNVDCDLIGAWPVGCTSPTTTRLSTWGAIKRSFAQ